MRRFLRPAVLAAAALLAAGTVSDTAGAIAHSDPSVVAEAPSGIVGIHYGNITRLGPWNRLCTGVVIARRWVLTAAHCVAEEETKYINIGVQRGETIDPYAVSTIIVHPKFPQGDENTLADIDVGYDLALVRTTTPMRRVRPMKPSKTWIGGSGRYVVYGYGRDESGDSGSDLGGREVFLANHLAGELTVNPGRQFAAVGSYEYVEETEDGTTTSETLYDGIARPGDSGGPVVLYRPDGRVEVAGIVSYGYIDGGPYPVVYTKVSRFAGWIATTLGTAN